MYQCDYIHDDFLQVKERKEANITIPAGVDNGERLRVVGRGHAGADGSSRAGDLYVVLQVQSPAPSESMFKRNGADVTVEVVLINIILLFV